MTISQERKELNLELRTWDDLTWINIERPTGQETEYLGKNSPFHPLDLDDCLSRIQRPKMDEYPDYLFFAFHFPVFNREARVTTSRHVAVFIGEKYLVILHKEEPKPLVKLVQECQIDEESRREHFSQGSGYLLYRLIDRLVDYCLPILNKIGDNIENVEEKIFSDEMSDTIEKISVLRRDVIFPRRIIYPIRAVIAAVLLPITVVASIFGMNIRLGFFGVSPYSGLYVFLIMITIISGRLYFSVAGTGFSHACLTHIKSRIRKKV